MSRGRTLKFIHIASTAWFMLCVGYILVLSLRKAGYHWWIIFSLSGHSVLIVLMLISLYLFAIFRGISSSQKVALEHPLTSTTYYGVFYVIAPFWGSLAGFLGTIGIHTSSHFLAGVALGTLWTTFLIWVIVDPITGLLETLLPPSSRRHRTERLAKAKAMRQNKQKDRERLLKEVFVDEVLKQRSWREELQPKAEKLAELLTANEIDFKLIERQAIGIGVNAWRMGGLSCMRMLRDMAVTIAEEKNKTVIDYIGVWWDGIGSWREPSLG